MGAVVQRVAEAEAFGPYRLCAQLSEGGMGVVYRARHVETGEEVALKTVRLLDPGQLRAIRREIHALRRLRHPCVVRVLAEGVSAGIPWYAMELLEGKSLRNSLSAWWEGLTDRGRLPAAAGELARALRLVHSLCGALSFIHGAGLVHRDLKPENVVVRPNGFPVLVDFGLAAASGGATSRESLEVAGAVEGSFGYMAPEQISGELVDARADLYALGCIVYELLTGRPVFQGRGHEILRQHLSESPRPPSELVEGLPPRLEELTLRLLAKHPRDRMGYADDVAAVLAELGAAGPPAVPAGRAYLYRPEFTGRARLLGLLDQALDRAKLGHGQCILLGAESGAGKTRMAMEVATSANRRAFRVITGECVPVEGESRAGTGVRGSPLHPFKPLLLAVADYCRARGPGATPKLLGAHAAVLALYEPALARLPGQPDPLPEPPMLPVPEARQRLLDALTFTLAAFAVEQPLLLVLDDLQWADELSLSMLVALARMGLEGRRLLVLGTYRTEEESVLADVLGAPGLLHELLGRLDQATVARIVGDMLALPSPPEPFVRFLAERSAGNPFFVAEYLRTAVSEGVLSRTATGRWEVGARGHALDYLQEALPLPGSLRELLERWLAGLNAAARELLEVASVLGREFDGELLRALSAAGDDLDELEILEALRARSVLEEAGAGRLRFAHDKLREIAYAGIPAARRRALHGSLAACIEARSGNDPLSYGVLAHHWVMAEVPDKSFEYLERAGLHALRTGANRDAARFFEQAIELERRTARDNRRRRAGWERLLGESYYGLGEIARAREHLERAFVELGRPLPRSRAGWAGLLAAQMARQSTHLLHPPATVTDGPEGPLRVATLAASRLCEIYYFGQDMLATTVAAVLAVNLAERIGRQSEVRKQYAQLGYMAGLMRLHPLARRYFRKATAGPEQEDPNGIGIALWYESSYEETFGRWTRGIEAAEDAIQRLSATGDLGELQVARTLRGHADYYLGRFEESLPRFEEIRAAAKARGNVQYEAWGTYSGARSLIALGRLDEAVERMRTSLELLKGQEERASEFICRGLLATAYLYRGELDAARAEADIVLEMSEGKQPTAFMERHGYEGAAMAYLALWAREADPRSTGRARRACALLSRFAGFIPLALPAALHCRGQLERLRGRVRRAHATWERGLGVCREMEMPYDEALILLELARALPASRERDAYLDQSASIFERLKCTWHRRQVELVQGTQG